VSPVIYAAIFFSLLGFTMTGPVLPAMRLHFGLSAAQTGLITSAFPLGMFAGVFIFPALSDIVGRKPMLVVSYLGVGLGLGLQAASVRYGLSFGTFLALRTATGAFAGASTVVKAYLADASPPEKLPQVMAYREAAATLSFIVGPVLGGLALAASSLDSILTIECLTSLTAGVLVLLFLREVRPARPSSWQAQSPSSNGQQAPQAPKPSCSATGDPGQRAPLSFGKLWVAIVLTMFVSWSYNVGQSFFDGFFPLLCAERHGLPAPIIGTTQTMMAITVFVATAAFYSRAVARLGLVQTAALGLTLIGAGVAVIGLAGTWSGALFGVLLYAVGIPLFSPSVAAILSRSAPAGRRGLVLGMDSAVNAVGRVAAPALAGRLYEVNPTHAFCLMGSVILLGAAAAHAGRRSLHNTSPQT